VALVDNGCGAAAKWISSVQMLRWSIALFTVFGIRLEMHATFVLLLGAAAWLGWADGGGLAASFWAVGLVLLMFVVVVLHELGHALAASRYGIHASRILLLPIGGMAEFDSIPRQPRREIVIALAGPAVNYLLVILIALFFGWPKSIAEIGTLHTPAGIPAVLLWVNLVMGLFNLLPAFPMDGGRVLRALLALRFDYLAATRWAARAGQTIALLLAAGAACVSVFGDDNLWLLAVLFLFIAYGAETEYRFVRNREFYAGLIVANVTRGDFLAFPPETSVATAFETLRRSVPQDLLLIGASGPVGIVPRARIAAALRNGRDLEPLSQHAEHEFTVLQAEWPLGPVVADFTRGKQRLFPVYSFDRLIGVLDTGRIDEAVRLIRLTRQRW